MQCSALLLAAFASIATAQNPITFMTLPESIAVGTTFNITWAPSTGTIDTVSLILRQGNPDALATVATIAGGIQNTGSYLWTPSTSLVNGDSYAFEIVDDSNTNIVNYSGQFAISSPNAISSAAASSITSLSASAASELTSSGSASTTSSSESGSSNASMTSSGSKTATGSASATMTTTVPTTSGNAAAMVGLKVSGGLLALVGSIMVWL